MLTSEISVGDILKFQESGADCNCCRFQKRNNENNQPIHSLRVLEIVATSEILLYLLTPFNFGDRLTSVLTKKWNLPDFFQYQHGWILIRAAHVLEKDTTHEN